MSNARVVNVFSRESRRAWLSAEENKWLLERLHTADFTHKHRGSSRLSYAVRCLNAGEVFRGIDHMLRAFQIDHLLDEGGTHYPARIKFYQHDLECLRIFHEPGSNKAWVIAFNHRRVHREKEKYRKKTFDISRGHLSLYVIIQWLFEWRDSRSMDPRKRIMWLKRSGLVAVGGHEPRRTLAAEVQIRYAQLRTKGSSPLESTQIALSDPEGANSITQDDPSAENITVPSVDVFAGAADNSLPTFDVPELETRSLSPEIPITIPKADISTEDDATSPQ